MGVSRRILREGTERRCPLTLLSSKQRQANHEEKEGKQIPSHRPSNWLNDPSRCSEVS